VFFHAGLAPGSPKGNNYRLAIVGDVFCVERFSFDVFKKINSEKAAKNNFFITELFSQINL